MSKEMRFNLDNLEIASDAKPQRFTLKGKEFQTVDLSELEWGAFEEAWGIYTQTENPRPVINMLLGPDAKRFWAVKPSLFQVMGLIKELEPVIKSVFGDPGEYNGSVTSWAGTAKN
ncbi:hypothetical protein QP868_02275 [Brevibacterium sp. UMB1308A]|uniref:hypothetical protein n=1 Tax=Brevibacterium sp. UMB1308A TaxID=3050608 RepID=UPI00254D156F|nr:hypothetical protein [Brevibacterium sp. UMB1308A]MDK8345428.1 hypothetical protein [Brevibacterium sp. UMB1308B]MDK8712725.1 hypothetical protein [Brevibacterium sp. UMB1308A]